MDLTEFLAARLDEDEAAAKAATPGPWAAETFIDEPDPAGVEYLVAAPAEAHIVVGAGLGHDQAEAETVHIARHDPARVLREVEAKRALLAGHEGVRRCDWGEHRGGDFGPCKQVRIIAAVWNNHPDYDEDWKP